MCNCTKKVKQNTVKQVTKKPILHRKPKMTAEQQKRVNIIRRNIEW